jgi:hypothetical protein
MCIAGGFLDPSASSDALSKNKPEKGEYRCWALAWRSCLASWCLAGRLTHNWEQTPACIINRQGCATLQKRHENAQDTDNLWSRWSMSKQTPT